MQIQTGSLIAPTERLPPTFQKELSGHKDKVKEKSLSKEKEKEKEKEREKDRPKPVDKNIVDREFKSFTPPKSKSSKKAVS